MKRILIVEDDRDIGHALNLRLQSAGYEVTVAEDAVLAMSRAVAADPDLVILDISMPGGDGFDVAERLRSEPRTAGVPYIFITASKLPELRKNAELAGCVGYFEKPFDSRELLECVESVLTQVG